MFKVGDWVMITDVDGETIHRLDEDRLYLIKQLYKGSVELWQPRKNEWCWHYSMLGQVTSIDNNKIIFAVKTSDGDMHNFILDSYDELEPFLGTLPSFLQN